MRSKLFARCLAIAVAIAIATPATGHAQIFKKLKETVKQAAEEETLSQVDVLVRDKVKCVFNDLECIRRAEDAGEEYVLTDPDGEVLVGGDGQPVSDPDEANAIVGATSGAAPDLSTMQTAAQPGLNEADANFDFEPGDRVLFEDDYTNDNVGDFPRRMNFRKGNWDVVEWNGRRWLRNTGPRHAALDIPLPQTLPETFTIEFDAYFPHTNQQLIVATAPPPENGSWQRIPGNAFRVGVGGSRTGVIALGDASVESMTDSREVGDGPVPIRIMVDGKYAKMFVGTRRIANVPNAEFTRTDRIYLENVYFADDENPMLIGPIRIAAGGRDLYDVLAADGRVATQGIHFDVNSATIRPESSGTLEEIGTMLQEHPDLRIAIEGHTDGDGDEASNQDLSERRAASVKDYLVARYGIDAGRLESAGFGESRPVAPNDTAEGKQQNRRVELVRLGDA
jgi:OmpA-OmpF porin, OOP family